MGDNFYILLELKNIPKEGLKVVRISLSIRIGTVKNRPQDTDEANQMEISN